MGKLLGRKGSDYAERAPLGWGCQRSKRHPVMVTGPWDHGYRGHVHAVHASGRRQYHHDMAERTHGTCMRPRVGIVALFLLVLVAIGACGAAVATGHAGHDGQAHVLQVPPLAHPAVDCATVGAGMTDTVYSDCLSHLNDMEGHGQREEGHAGASSGSSKHTGGHSSSGYDAAAEGDTSHCKESATCPTGGNARGPGKLLDGDHGAHGVESPDIGEVGARGAAAAAASVLPSAGTIADALRATWVALGNVFKAIGEGTTPSDSHDTARGTRSGGNVGSVDTGPSPTVDASGGRDSSSGTCVVGSEGTAPQPSSSGGIHGRSEDDASCRIAEDGGSVMNLLFYGTGCAWRGEVQTAAPILREPVPECAAWAGVWLAVALAVRFLTWQTPLSLRGCNTVISLIHSLFAFGLAVVAVFAGGRLRMPPPLAYEKHVLGHLDGGVHPADLVLAVVALGYFIFDSIAITMGAVCGGARRLDMLLHHAVAMMALVAALNVGASGVYVVWGVVLTESANPLLHLRTLLRHHMGDIRHSSAVAPVALAVDVLFALVFFVSRVVVGLALVICIFISSNFIMLKVVALLLYGVSVHWMKRIVRSVTGAVRGDYEVSAQKWGPQGTAETAAAALAASRTSGVVDDDTSRGSVDSISKRARREDSVEVGVPVVTGSSSSDVDDNDGVHVRGDGISIGRQAKEERRGNRVARGREGAELPRDHTASVSTPAKDDGAVGSKSISIMTDAVSDLPNPTAGKGTLTNNVLSEAGFVRVDDDTPHGISGTGKLSLLDDDDWSAVTSVPVTEPVAGRSGAKKSHQSVIEQSPTPGVVDGELGAVQHHVDAGVAQEPYASVGSVGDYSVTKTEEGVHVPDTSSRHGDLQVRGRGAAVGIDDDEAGHDVKTEGGRRVANSSTSSDADDEVDSCEGVDELLVVTGTAVPIVGGEDEHMQGGEVDGDVAAHDLCGGQEAFFPLHEPTPEDSAKASGAATVSASTSSVAPVLSMTESSTPSASPESAAILRNSGVHTSPLRSAIHRAHRRNSVD